MKTGNFVTVLSASAFIFASLPGQARENHRYYEEARVISADPVYQSVRVSTPRQECWDEPVYHAAQSSTSRTPEILGAIIGGAIGNEFGHGSGRDIATIAGAVLGGSVGHDIKSNKQNHSGKLAGYEEKCRTVKSHKHEERLDGYNVRYRYNGEIFSTHTKQHPGDTIRLSVRVTPVE